jgi:amino acid transporter
MKLEQLNARVMAVVVFFMIITVSLAISLALVVFLEFYWDIAAIFGHGPNAGSIYELLVYLVASVLTVLSFYLAYRGAKKVYMLVLLYEASQGGAVPEFKDYVKLEQSEHVLEQGRKT